MSTATLTASSTTRAGKYLTVVLANEAYGIAALKVREIIRHQKITPVPQMPAHVCGVINLRGRVIPITDLRIKFGLPAEVAERTCIVVVQVRPSPTVSLQLGLVVDAVEEVANLSDAEIEPTPDFGHHLDTRYILGMAKIAGQVKTLLDLDRVFGAGEMDAIAAP
ncbi:MAG: chemotaxis protein CheW [Verrucomicrobia bacterium]|nr:chemotaxis protein CheW [Verrucomicrobiota bacterium]